MSVPSLSSSTSVSTLSSLSVSILCFPLCLSLFVTLVYPYFSPRCPLYFSPRCPLYLSPGVPFFLTWHWHRSSPHWPHPAHFLLTGSRGGSSKKYIYILYIKYKYIYILSSVYIYLFIYFCLTTPWSSVIYIFIVFFARPPLGVASLKHMLV